MNKENKELAIVSISALALAGVGFYYLYNYMKENNNSLTQKINSLTTQNNNNLEAVSSATGEDLGYLQNEINDVQAQALLSETNPNISFGSVNGSNISAPTGASIHISNQAPAYNTDLNNGGVKISGSSGNPNAKAQPKLSLPFFTAGETL